MQGTVLGGTGNSLAAVSELGKVEGATQELRACSSVTEGMW